MQKVAQITVRIRAGQKTRRSAFPISIGADGTDCDIGATYRASETTFSAAMKLDLHTNARIAARLTQAAVAVAAPEKPAVKGGQSAQTNSMEEVGMTFSHHVERSSKALRQRHIRGARNETNKPRIEDRSRLEEEYEQLGHPGKISLDDMARDTGILLGRQPMLQEVVDSTGGDPARTDVVLQEVARLAEAAGQKLEAKRARDYLQMLRDRYSGEIQAGMNIAQALRAAGGDPVLRQAVRRLYYDTVVLKQSLSTMMQSLLGLFGESEFVPGLDMMRTALADDIAAETPSRPTAKLRVLLLGLNASTQLSGVLQGCRSLIERLASSCPATQLTSVGLLQRLLAFAAGGLTPSEVRRIGRELGGEQEREQLITLNALYPVIQRLPLPLWRDGKSRQAALKNVLTLLDQRSIGGTRGTTARPVLGANA
jgi:type III secretion protein W